MVRPTRRAGELPEITGESSIAAGKQDLPANDPMNREDSRTVDRSRRTPSAEPGEPEISADPNRVHLEDIRARIQRLQEEEQIMNETAAYYERQFGEALDRYPKDVADYVAQRSAARESLKRRHRNSLSQDTRESQRSRTDPNPTTPKSYDRRRHSDFAPVSTPTLARRAKVVEPDPYQGKSIGELRTYKMAKAFELSLHI
jgi:cell division protein FtsN